MYIYTHTKVFLLKTWERTPKKKDGKIGKHKLNEMGALNMKWKKWNKQDKSKRSSYSPVVFKHGCSLETHLELWWKKQYLGICIFQKIPNNSVMQNFKKWLQVFLLKGSFGDLELYYFLLTNRDTIILHNSCIITIVKDVYQFS